MIGKLIFLILFTIVGIAFSVYYLGQMQETSKEIDKLKLEEQQTLNELKQAYDECRTLKDKSYCDSLVAKDPKADEIIHD